MHPGEGSIGTRPAAGKASFAMRQGRAHLEVGAFVVALRHAACDDDALAPAAAFREHRRHLALTWALHSAAVDEPHVCIVALTVLGAHPARAPTRVGG